jgi:hypothetical protein
MAHIEPMARNLLNPTLMNPSRLALGAAAALAAITVAGERQASACGGCFQPPQQSVSDITDERMLLAVSPVQTTLYDQVKYSGSPSSFAWVLPIRGTVQVGLSADVLFDSVAALTQTVINPPPVNCPAPNCPVGNFGGGASFSAGSDASAAAPAVQVLVSQNVGPYATVQLRSTDGTALDNWLTQNGYNIPTAVQPILAAYVTEGFDFLAMKLLPDQGVQSMRPVRVTTPGASLSLPLRMASIGTGAITGITIWVVADGRYEPQNFPFFHIDDSALVWDFSVSSSNYTTLRTQNEANVKNAGWEIESSISLNEQSITNVIQSGGQYYGYGGGRFYQGGQPSDPALDYLPIGNADAGTDGGDGGYESAEQVRADDIAALFVGMSGPTVRVTRMRSDIAQTAMTKDFVLTASSDQSEVSNVHNLTNSVSLTCPVYNGCNVVGQGSPSQAAATADGGYVASVAPDGGIVLSAAPRGGGCATSPGDAGSGLGLGVLAGMLGLVAARGARARRRG